MKVFGIDFIRQALEQTLLEEHLKEPTLYLGGKNQVNLFSFYEQLQKEDEVDRYVDIYRDLTEQQNRTGLIMNGTIVAPENPTITNLYSCYISPMSFTCSFRVKLADRDMTLETINHLIETLKGRKVDIAMFESGKLFKVGTICNGVRGLATKSGDFLGTFDSDYTTDYNITNIVKPRLTALGITFDESGYYYMVEDADATMIVVKRVDGTWTTIEDDGTYGDIIFPPQNEMYDSFKLSLSFDSIRCDEPRNLNANEYCTISFGGSATLVSYGVALGNDLLKVNIKRKIIKATTDITINDINHWLEPLELPSGNNVESQLSQLTSNNFITNSHNDSISIALQYTFILDKNESLLNHFFKYGRYGIQATATNNYVDGITPNMIYEITEVWSSWGQVEIFTYKAKITESIDIEATESDTLTIKIPLQLQGDND